MPLIRWLLSLFHHRPAQTGIPHPERLVIGRAIHRK